MRDGVTVRTERPADLAAIRAVNEAAFPTGAEAGLVDALRDAGAFAEGGSLVAECGDEVVGHLLLSVARLDTGPSVLALAPMAVLPAHQRSGVGSALVREGLAARHAPGIRSWSWPATRSTTRGSASGLRVSRASSRPSTCPTRPG